MAVADMLARRQPACVATSSGNTGAALAAYCAAAGIRCTIAIVETAPAGKLSQMLAYGARLLRVRQFGLDAQITDQTFRLLQTAAAAWDDTPKISAYCYCPRAMQGVETLGYELATQAAAMDTRIDHVFVPAGGGGLALGVSRGLERAAQLGRAAQVPRIHCVQPAGNDTIASPLRDGSSRARAVTSTTAISGLQVANVLDGHQVIAHCRASGGTGYAVSDQQIWDAQQRLAREEGVFCEPAGAVALAGALQANQLGQLDRSAKAVCLITGSGFKDPASLERMNCDQQVPFIQCDQLPQYLA
jgi:threonine synthase